MPELVLGVSSPGISVVSSTRIYDAFSEEMDTFAVEVAVADNIAKGSYSLYVQSRSGLRKHLFGVFVVD